MKKPSQVNCDADVGSATRIEFSELCRTQMISGTFNFMIGAARSPETMTELFIEEGGVME